jgi:hypothetical protein
MVSANGSPARPLSWVQDNTFRQGNAILTFRRSDASGPFTVLRFDGGPSAFLILKKQ